MNFLIKIRKDAEERQNKAGQMVQIEKNYKITTKDSTCKGMKTSWSWESHNFCIKTPVSVSQPRDLVRRAEIKVGLSLAETAWKTLFFSPALEDIAG